MLKEKVILAVYLDGYKEYGLGYEYGYYYKKILL